MRLRRIAAPLGALILSLSSCSSSELEQEAERDDPQHPATTVTLPDVIHSWHSQEAPPDFDPMLSPALLPRFSPSGSSGIITARVSHDQVQILIKPDDGTGLASLGINRGEANSPLNCDDRSDGQFTAMKATALSIQGCGFLNESGIFFFRWHDSGDTYLLQLQGLSASAAVAYLETWDQQ